jgi:hypothetical protein
LPQAGTIAGRTLVEPKQAAVAGDAEFEVLPETPQQGKKPTFRSGEDRPIGEQRQYVGAPKRGDGSEIGGGPATVQRPEERGQASQAQARSVAATTARAGRRGKKRVQFYRTPLFVGAVVLSGMAVAGYGVVAWYFTGPNVPGAIEEGSVPQGDSTTPEKTASAQPRAASAEGGAIKHPPMIGAGVELVGGSSSRAIAPGALQIEGKSVSVEWAKLGPVDGQAKGDYLSLRLRITNRGEKTIRHQSWTGPDIGVILRDVNGRYYNPKPAAEQAETAIEPGRTVAETLLFEATPAGTSLDLDLPASNGAGTFQFRLPFLFIEVPRPNAPASRVASAPSAARPPAPPFSTNGATASQETKLASPPPADPEKDPRLKATLVSEYNDGKRRIERRARGMSFDESNRYKRNAPKELLKSLAEKHKLELEQVRRIVGVE